MPLVAPCWKETAIRGVFIGENDDSGLLLRPDEASPSAFPDNPTSPV